MGLLDNSNTRYFTTKVDDRAIQESYKAYKASKARTYTVDSFMKEYFGNLDLVLIQELVKEKYSEVFI